MSSFLYLKRIYYSVRNIALNNENIFGIAQQFHLFSGKKSDGVSD